MTPRNPRIIAVLGFVVSACLSLDPFLFTPESVDTYDWDADPCDPQLAGELAEAEGRGERCHPSKIPASQRIEGFVESSTDDDPRRVHYVYAHHGEARATLVYAHGRARHLGRYWDRVERLHALGFNVLIFDYPTYGRSTGTLLNENTVYGNANAVLDHVTTLPFHDPTRVFLYGYSLGAAVAMHSAAHWPARRTYRPRGVITESGFCSVQTLVDDGAFLNLPRTSLAENDFSTCDAIARLASDIPTLVLHGADDTFVLPVHAELILEAAEQPPEYQLVAGADHTEIPTMAGADYSAWLTSFIARSSSP